jgi:hypothetical protein
MRKIQKVVLSWGIQAYLRFTRPACCPPALATRAATGQAPLGKRGRPTTITMERIPNGYVCHVMRPD